MAALYNSDTTRPLNPTDPSVKGVTILSSLLALLEGMAGGGAGGGARPTHTCHQHTSTTAPSKQAGMWQNWMSTTNTSVVMETDAMATTTSSLGNHHPHHHHHHHHHHHLPPNHHSHPAQEGTGGGDGDSGYGDSVKSSCSVPCDCHEPTTPPHTTPSTLTNSMYPYTSTQAQQALAQQTNTSVTVTQESSRRYCPCCYCELFGNNGPPTAPTSHNFTKQRDKMRLKLQKKRKETDTTKGGGANPGEAESDSRPVEDLVAFIEGEEGGHHAHQHHPPTPHPHQPHSPHLSCPSGHSLTSTAPPKGCSKKQRKKERKPASASGDENVGPSLLPHPTPSPSTPHTSTTSTSSSTITRAQTHGNPGAVKRASGTSQLLQEVTGNPKTTAANSAENGTVARNGSDGAVGDSCAGVDVKKMRPMGSAGGSKGPKGKTKVYQMSNGTAGGSKPERDPVGPSEEEVDEYDDELEAFKKFCFSAAPVETGKKKLPVALDMQAVRAKIK